MKKAVVLLLGIMVAFITIMQPVYGVEFIEGDPPTEESTAQLTETEAERIIDKYAAKIGVFFEETAEKLTPVAKDLYASYIKYLWADVIYKCVLNILCIILTYWLITIWLTNHTKAIKTEKDNIFFDSYASGPEPKPTVLLPILGSLVTLMFAIFTFSAYLDLTRLILAPEIVVAKEILHLL